MIKHVKVFQNTLIHNSLSLKALTDLSTSCSHCFELAYVFEKL